MIERRASAGKFLEWLSLILVFGSGTGAMFVLIDPVITFQTAAGTIIKIGGEGFSDQLKGAVVSMILVSGFAAVITYWLGASSQGAKAQDSVNTIATASAPSTAAAVAASMGAQAIPAKVDTVNVDATTANVNTDKGQS